MNFTSERQRKAIFANMNKFARGGIEDIERPIFTKQKDRVSLGEAVKFVPNVVGGYTGSNLVVIPGAPSIGPYVTYDEGIPVRDMDTFILAGENYKGMGANQDDIVDIASLERQMGRPVYSEAPKKKRYRPTAEDREIEEWFDMMDKAEAKKVMDMEVKKGSLEDLFKD